jgi:hypothetical protein
MNSTQPPRLAAWILQYFGPELNQEALSGDLNEAFQQGRSKAWYWRQVLAAIRWGRLLRPLLGSICLAWWMTFDWSAPSILSRPAPIAVFATIYFASLLAPSMMRRRLRVLLALLIALIFGFLWHYQHDWANHFWVFFWIVASNVVFYSEKPEPGPYHLTIRELLFGDPDAERQRLIEKLHLAMLQETDPQVCHAYAEAIASLKAHEAPTPNVTQ